MKKLILITLLMSAALINCGGSGTTPTSTSAIGAPGAITANEAAQLARALSPTFDANDTSGVGSASLTSQEVFTIGPTSCADFSEDGTGSGSFSFSIDIDTTGSNPNASFDMSFDSCSFTSVVDSCTLNSSITGSLGCDINSSTGTGTCGTNNTCSGITVTVNGTNYTIGETINFSSDGSYNGTVCVNGVVYDINDFSDYADEPYECPAS